MAKDYFQDIVPPHRKAADAHHVPVHTKKSTVPKKPLSPVRPVEDDEEIEETDVEEIPEVDEAPIPARGIRNIAPNPSRMRSRIGGYDTFSASKPKTSSNWWLWAIAGVCIVALAAFAFIAMRPTTITIKPRSQNIVFGESAQFVAYPADNAATGTLTYTVQTADYDESQVVESQGTEHVDARASGSATIYNGYSTKPQKLIKNTRFQTPEGLIFRTPADILIPGKVDTTPGKVTVTLMADQVGPQYNIGPVSRFSLPGLQSNSPMYTNIYGQSSAAMVGGQSGDQPAVAPADQTAAISAMRSRLEKTIHDKVVASSTPGTTVFGGLLQITYQDLPATSESENSIRLHERAHVQIPVFVASSFASTVAQTVTSNIESDPVVLIGQKDYDAKLLMASTTPNLGTDSISFSVLGNALLVWQVDAKKLALALAGRDSRAFQTIITGFPGVQEANAKVEPFWKKTFPTDANSIKVVIETPQVAR